ncbi:MAG: DsbA family oxidoreductase [Ilumatobacteraceae bacterium]
MRVEIWSDVVCPWCYIGKRRFEKALAILRDKGVTTPIEVVYRSYQLDPTAPAGSPTPVVEAYAKKFGGTDRAREILGHVTRVAAEDGIAFNMDIALRANTVVAHRALHWALTECEGSGTDAQSRLKESLLAAYFTEGLDVGDPDVVAACATAIGLDGAALRLWLDGDGGKDAVVADMRAGVERDISGVPAFVINDAFLVPGAQDAEVFVNVLERIISRASD